MGGKLTWRGAAVVGKVRVGSRSMLAAAAAEGLKLAREAVSDPAPASAPGETPDVDSGELLRSIAADVGAEVAHVGTPLAKGRILEFGTRDMAARPWIRPTVEALRRRMRSLARRHLG